MDDQQLARDMTFLAQEFTKVVEQHCGVRLEHDRASVAKLDQLFMGRLGQLAQDDFQSASVMTAAFLGETVRKLAGGHWHYDEHFGPCIIEVPGVQGILRVLSRAEKRIQGHSGNEALMDFLKLACPQRH